MSAPASLPLRATRLTTAFSLSLVLIKVLTGFYTGSVAIFASAVDSFFDFIVSTFNAVAVRSAEKPGDKSYNYGHGKMEGLAATFEGLLILGTAVFIARQALIRMWQPSPISNASLNLAAGVMTLSLIASLGITIYLKRATKLSPSLVLEADALHYRTDVYSNAVILLGMLAIRWTGWQMADPLLALAVSIYIVKEALPLLRKGLDMLLDRSLSASLVESIQTLASTHSKLVNGVHELKTRRSGDTNFVEFHLVFDEHISLGQAHLVADEIEARIRDLEKAKWSINVHLDPEDDSVDDRQLAEPPRV